MIKVVGKSKKYVFKTECKYCSSILEYTKADCKESSYTDYGGGTEYCLTITCPCCNNLIVVK